MQNMPGNVITIIKSGAEVASINLNLVQKIWCRIFGMHADHARGHLEVHAKGKFQNMWADVLGMTVEG